MYRSKTRRRFEKGDKVLSIYQNLGIGVISSITNQKKCYINYYGYFVEDVTQYIPYAKIHFGNDNIELPIGSIISFAQVEKYESLETGDMVVFGKIKKAIGIVLSNLPRKKTKNGINVTNRAVYVLVDGLKKKLSIRQEIISIQKASECI